jgi:tetratricopeptide (TPR) repeat protein
LTADNPRPSIGPSIVETALGHPEYALSLAQASKRQLDNGRAVRMNPAFVDIVQNLAAYQTAFLLGDYQTAAEQARIGATRSDSLTQIEASRSQVLLLFALLHDGAGLRAYGNTLLQLETPMDKAQQMIARLRAEGEFEHYRTVIAMEPEVEKTASAVGERFAVRDTFQIYLRPLLALARAKTGDITGAQALIALSPLDCYDCLLIRARISEQARQPAQADAWFSRAVHDAPSIPRAYADWGEAYLERGQPDAAIAKFKQANEKGPHFANPLEYWGEALMAKNRSHLALAKFAEAEKYAPNWGRLHLKWGEALTYAGKKDEAATQLARAAALDLTPSEKSELTGLRRN